MNLFSKNGKSTRRAFTLVELLVSLGIFALMTALMVTKYGNFNQSVLLTDLAYDIALSIRTAQTYGVSVQGTDQSGGPIQDFGVAYGIHFNISNNAAGCDAPSPTQFIFFSHGGPVVGAYNCSSLTDAIIIPSPYLLKRNAKVSRLCTGTDGKTCSGSDVSFLDIVFKRPDPDAHLYSSNGGNPNYAQVTIQAGNSSDTRTVSIYGNGQISVGN